MKHLSASALERAAKAAELVTDDELKARLRGRFEAAGCDKARLARSLGVTAHQLTLVLRGRGTITERLAKALGYRKVVRFERISTGPTANLPVESRIEKVE